MVEKEKLSECDSDGWKVLRLVTPETANWHDIPAESPVFISPDLSIKGKCEMCKVICKPLVYKVGIVNPHHFHTDGKLGGGGVYFYDGPVRIGRWFEWGERFYGWIAILKPIGQRFWASQPYPIIKRSESVRINTIKAYCSSKDTAERPLEYRHELKTGVLVENNGDCHPYCERCARPDLPVRFRFQISDSGEVHFSRI